MTSLNAQLLQLWQSYGVLLVLAAGLLGLVSLAGLAVWAKRTKKPLRPIALAVSMNLALLLNAEGMWVIAIDKLKLPEVFAFLVFAVFEICFLTATSLAAEQYRRTTVYDRDGKIVTPGHPGSMLYIAALIAGFSGVIVATNAGSFTEVLLRLAIPCVIFLMWWAALTAAGQKLRRSRFAYSPRRLAERWGWLIPDDDPDLAKMAADRQVRRMVVAHQRVAAAGWAARWWRRRLQRDARTADDGVVDQVVDQLARIERVMGLLAPDGGAPAGGERRTEPEAQDHPAPVVTQSVAASRRASRVRHRSLRRAVCVAHPKTVVVAAPEPRTDPRAAQDVDLVVRAIKETHPALPQRRIAFLADVPETTVRRALRRTQKPSAAQVNGSKPELASTDA